MGPRDGSTPEAGKVNRIASSRCGLPRKRWLTQHRAEPSKNRPTFVGCFLRQQALGAAIAAVVEPGHVGHVFGEFTQPTVLPVAPTG